MDFLKNLFNKEQAIYDTVQSALEDIATELQVAFSDLFIMIKPTNEKFDHKYWVYKLENGVPKPVREITLKQILGEDDE